MAVALFANLGQLQFHLTNLKAGSNRKMSQIKALYHQIFPERTEVHLRTFGTECFYFFHGQQADLTMPFSTVSVCLDAPILYQYGVVDFMLAGSSLFTDTNCTNGCRADRRWGHDDKPQQGSASRV